VIASVEKWEGEEDVRDATISDPQLSPRIAHAIFAGATDYSTPALF